MPIESNVEEARATNGAETGRVSGVVRGPDGAGIAAANITLLSRRLRAADLEVGNARSGADGTYAITYRGSRAVRPDLLVTVRHGTVEMSSAVIMDAGPDEIIDVVLGGSLVGPSAFTATTTALQQDNSTGRRCDCSPTRIC